MSSRPHVPPGLQAKTNIEQNCPPGLLTRITTPGLRLHKIATMPSHCNPHLCSDRLKHVLLPCFSFRCTSYSTSNTMLSARSALTASAATEHDNEPLLVKAAKTLLAKATCQEAKRPRKSGKGTESKRPKKSGKGTGFHARKTSSDSATSSDTETPVPTVLPSDDELPVPTVLPSDDDGG